jgi:hypothetical protein
LLGEDSIRPFTRAIVNGLEALLFGAGLAFGLTRRPKANHGDTENTGNAQRIG